MANSILLRFSLLIVRFIYLITPALSWIWKILKILFWCVVAIVIILLLLLIL